MLNLWEPNPGGPVSTRRQKEWQVGMPLHTHSFVFMLQSFDYLQLLVTELRNLDLSIIPGRCDVVAVGGVAHTAHLLRMELLTGDTLPLR